MMTDVILCEDYVDNVIITTLILYPDFSRVGAEYGIEIRRLYSITIIVCVELSSFVEILFLGKLSLQMSIKGNLFFYQYRALLQA